MNEHTTPLVSVIIPCYNYGAYVGEAIESILRQTYPNWELVVVDDGSTDDTAEQVKPFLSLDHRVRYHYQPNKGLSAARNTGLALTTGEFVQLLDADDYLADDKLRLQVQLLQENPQIDLVYSDTYIFDNALSTRNPADFQAFKLAVTPKSGTGIDLLLHMASDNMFLPGAPLYRRRMEKIVQGFREDMYPMEDWHYWYRALLHQQWFQHDSRPAVAHFARDHGENMSKKRRKFWENRVIARQYMLPIIEVHIGKSVSNSSLQPVLAENQALLKQEKARYHLLYGKLTTGIYNALRTAIVSPSAYDTLYESAYLLKERILGRNKV